MIAYSKVSNNLKIAARSYVRLWNVYVHTSHTNWKLGLNLYLYNLQRYKLALTIGGAPSSNTKDGASAFAFPSSLAAPVRYNYDW